MAAEGFGVLQGLQLSGEDVRNTGPTAPVNGFPVMALTFAGAADWLAGWCGVWVCRPGGGRSWGPVARRGGAVP